MNVEPFAGIRYGRLDAHAGFAAPDDGKGGEWFNDKC